FLPIVGLLKSLLK
nr:Chain A, temporinB_L1FK [synthetic construct]